MPQEAGQKSRPPRQRSLQLILLLAFVGLLAGTVLLIIGFTYYINARATEETSKELIRKTNETIIEKTLNYLKPASHMAQMSARLLGKEDIFKTNRAFLESFAIEIIETFPQLACLDVGDEQGNFLMPKRQPDGTIATKIIRRGGEHPGVVWKYRDTRGQVMRTTHSPNIEFDPRKRPWYQGAKSAGKLYWTDVYVWFTDKKPGISAAAPIRSESGQIWGVLAADILLDELSGFLKRLKVSRGGIAFIINDKQEFVAYPDMSRILMGQGTGLRLARVDEIGIPYIVNSFKAFRQHGPNQKFEFTSEGTTYLAQYTPFPRSFDKNWTIVIIVPEDDFVGHIKTTNWISFAITIVIFLLGIVIGRRIARSISKPIEVLTNEAKKIQDFHLDGEVAVPSQIEEIRSMTDGISSMKSGLRAFQKYVPAGLVRKLVATQDEAHLGGKRQELTVLFSDIVGFTTIAEDMGAEDLMVHLSEYLDELTRIIMDLKGTVDKYMGDGIMAFWGAPTWDEDHASHACQAALQCQKRLRELNEKWTAEGKSPMLTRFGINTGEVVVGNLGSRERMNYSVIGDNVNVASRMEGANKAYGTTIVISHATQQRVEGRFLVRPLDFVVVKGRNEPIQIFELLADVSEPGAETEQRTATYVQAFDLYMARKWPEAIAVLEQLRAESADQVVDTLLERCRSYTENPPSSDDWWYRKLTEK